MTAAYRQVRIFICYRRAGASGYVTALVDPLEAEFGKDVVFTDSRQWPGGDFRRNIDEAVNSCQVLLVVIDPQWLTWKDPAGNIRLFQPDDFVRLEIAAGLRRGIPIIPLLVGRADMPAAKDLPEDIRDFAFRNAFELRDASWSEDLVRFIKILRGIIGKRGWPAWLKIATAAPAVLLVILGFYLGDKFRGAPKVAQPTRPTSSPSQSTTPQAGLPPTAQPSPLAPPDDKFVGTVWKGGTPYERDAADYTITFLDAENVKWVSTPKGGGPSSTKTCRYRYSSDALTIECRGNANRDGSGASITLSGRVSGDKITGRGNNNLFDWTWEARKVE